MKTVDFTLYTPKQNYVKNTIIANLTRYYCTLQSNFNSRMPGAQQYSCSPKI